MMFWLVALVAVLWCGMGALTFRSLRGTTILRVNQPTSPLKSFPKVSIIVAARNEEEALPVPLNLVNDPTSSRALAAGAFILMKREDLTALGGYARLRNVLIEDLRLAELFKRHGRRIYLAASRGLFHTRMYSSGGEMFEGLSRSAFEGSGFSVPKILGAVFLANLLAVFPWAALIARILSDLRFGRPAWHDPVLLFALVACTIASLVYLPFIRHLRVPVLYVFALPLATLFYSCVAMNSAFAGIVGGGVPWKGRRYRAPVE